jgi:hypothetical protein
MRGPAASNRRLAATLSLVTAALAMPHRAGAESGLVNLNLEGAFAGVLSGGAMSAGPGLGLAFGGDGALAADLQFAPPVAVEVLAGVGGLSSLNHPWLHAAVGARIRILDQHEGYPNEPEGRFTGNLFVSAHVGYHWFETSQISGDVAFGSDLPLFRPVQLEMFARLLYLQSYDASGVSDLVLQLGAGISYEIGPAPGSDHDHDGVSNAREVRVYHTDPRNADTDHDGIPDGREIRTGTNPRSANLTGGHEPVTDVPAPGADNDHDGVPDDRDACLDSPPGSLVDPQGCRPH